MNVLEYAQDMGKSVEEIISKCKKIGINVNTEEDMLSDDDIVELDIAFSNESEEESVQNFLTAFEAKFGKEGGTWNALGYDAAMLIIDAIERSGSTDPQAITDAIAETTEFAGVTGTFAIDENHNPVKPAVMIELQDGEIASAENVTAE